MNGVMYLLNLTIFLIVILKFKISILYKGRPILHTCSSVSMYNLFEFNKKEGKVVFHLTLSTLKDYRTKCHTQW